MPRLASIAVGGYYPLPDITVPDIAALINTQTSGEDIAILDPCAGDGAAMIALAKQLVARRGATTRIAYYASELEEERASQLASNIGTARGSRDNALWSDWFRVVFSRKGSYTRDGISLALVNPPYDTDRVHGRLEHRFLLRVTDALASLGVLVLVVPYHALQASAVHLAQTYDHLSCFRMPEPIWHDYKQVVLFARKMESPLPAHAINHTHRARVENWASHPELIPVLPAAGTQPPVVNLPSLRSPGFDRFVASTIDLTGTRASFRPWVMSGSRGTQVPVSHLGVDSDIDSLFARGFEVAMPLKQAHLALALAAGGLNGHRVEPDDPHSGLPPILARAIFEREYETVDERKDKKGNVKQIVQVQQPKLIVCVLDLRSSMYYDLQPGSEPSGARSIHEFNIADLIVHYGQSLLAIVRQQYPALHDRDNPCHQMDLVPTARNLFTIQRHAAQTAIKLALKGRHPWILGEVGTGKTTVTQQVLWAFSDHHLATTEARTRATGIDTIKRRPIRRVLVLCPPHVLHTWHDELGFTLPGARVTIIESLSDLDAVAGPLPKNDLPGSGMHVAILSRETAKLGYALQPAVEPQRTRCPRCGAVLPKSEIEKLVSLRAHCQHQPTIAESPTAKLAVTLAATLAPAYPEDGHVIALCAGRVLRRVVKRAHAIPKDERDPMRWCRVACPDDRPLIETHAGRIMRAIVDRLVVLIQDRARGDESTDLYKALQRLAMAVVHPDRDALLVACAQRIYQATVADTDAYGVGPDARRQALMLLLYVEDDTVRTDVAVQLAAIKLNIRTYSTYGMPSSASPFDQFTKTSNRLRRSRQLAFDLLAGRVALTPQVEARITPSDSEDWWFARIAIDMESGLVMHETVHGDADAALVALHQLVKIGGFTQGEICDAPLYQPVVGDQSPKARARAGRSHPCMAATKPGTASCPDRHVYRAASGTPV